MYNLIKPAKSATPHGQGLTFCSTILQQFFLTHPEINIAGFAERFGFNATLIRSYINGFKKPSPQKEQAIIDAITQLGEEYRSIL